MKKYIKSADYTNYNANNRGNDTSDCVKRALSLAFDMDYNDVSKLLIHKMKDLGRSAWNILPVFGGVISDISESTRQKLNDTYTVSEFIDNVATTGTYIIGSGDKPGAPSHLLCCIDGKVYDSWDSRNQYVTYYWKVDNIAHDFSDIESSMDEFADFAESTVEELCQAQFDKYGYDSNRYVFDIRASIDGYTIHTISSFTYKLSDDNRKQFSFKISFVLSPTTPIDTVEDKIRKVAKVRVYDRIYLINKSIADEEEAINMLKDSSNIKQHLNLLTPQAYRFYNNLPGWAKGITYTIDIDNPGQYYDSYKLYLNPLPGDSNKDIVKFYGYDAATIREELKRYKSNYARVDIDYYFDEL